ncbi:hypothetical protein [Streptomyces xinghaiensis]|uniref:hypothetical protein n=1 Tax=Streptomyces xinghaiensis TaxID=1038928 RepID=UPI00030F1F08|nr:hypothetical protein [Streptomyces xinghaiensis]MZE79612.1 hypothetical protein [Streptomyces sp. SID5475]
MVPHLDRLAERATRRRLELGLGVEPAARSAGISKDTWKRVERGARVRDTSYAHMERALGWAPGSCRLVLSGGEPVPVERAKADPEVVIASLPREEVEASIRQALESAAIAVTDLQASKIREMNERVLEDLRRRRLI